MSKRKKRFQFNQKMKINRKLLPIKGHYFLFAGTIAPVWPFLPVILKDLGFSPLVIGTIFTFVPLLSFPFKPILGGIADKFQCQKLIFILLIIVQLFFFLSTNWLPSLPKVTSEIVCDHADAQLKICSEQFKNTQMILQPNFSCIVQLSQDFTYSIEINGSKLDEKCLYLPIEHVASNSTEMVGCNGTYVLKKTECENKALTQLLSSPSVTDDQVVSYYQFWIVLFVITMAQTCRLCLTSIGDTICFNLLGDNPTDFGLSRLAGSAGWGIALVTGVIVDMSSEGSDTKNFLPAYIFLVVFAILDLLVSFKIEFKVVTEPAKNIIKDVFKVIQNRHILIFMFWCFLNGVYFAMIWNFLFWFLEDVAANNGYGDMTYIKTLEGLVLAFHTYFGEIPCFFISSWVIRKMGHVNCMSFVLATAGVRYIYYSYLTNPWWTLPVETFNGVSYALFYAIMTTYACTFSPPGTETTVQSLVAALFDALGSSVGSFIGGFLIQKIGGVWTFWYLGLSSLFFSALIRIIYLFIGKPNHEIGTPDVQDEKTVKSLNLESDIKKIDTTL